MLRKTLILLILVTVGINFYYYFQEKEFIKHELLQDILLYILICLQLFCSEDSNDTNK